MFQLEKIYGKSKEAREFISSLISGVLSALYSIESTIESLDTQLYPSSIPEPIRGQHGTPHPQAWLVLSMSTWPNFGASVR